MAAMVGLIDQVYHSKIHLMESVRKIPQSILAELSNLDRAYLAEQDPIRQSRFSGGTERWKAERTSIIRWFTAVCEHRKPRE
jgi:hypothetical protein